MISSAALVEPRLYACNTGTLARSGALGGQQGGTAALLEAAAPAVTAWTLPPTSDEEAILVTKTSCNVGTAAGAKQVRTRTLSDANPASRKGVSFRFGITKRYEAPRTTCAPATALSHVQLRIHT